MSRGPDASGAVHANVILSVLLLAGLGYAALSSAVIPALPTIQHDLNTTETGVTWVLTGFLLSASVGTAIIGRLGDMYGKERLLLYTLLVLAAGTLLAAVANSLAVLIVARVIQGAGGGIFPLSFSIARDEFPPDRVAGSMGVISAVLGIGGGAGLVLGAVLVEQLSWHWLFWVPLAVILLAAVCTWRFVPESPVRTPGHVNWPAAALMSVGMCCVLIAISETTVWGWGGAKTIALFAVGALVIVAWIAVEVHSREPLVDMTMMRIRGVWTTNLVGFLLGAGMYASFIVFPQFAQLPKSTGFGFGATIVVSSLYLLPGAFGMGVLGTFAGRVARRFGSKPALITGIGITAAAFGWLAVAHAHPFDMLASSTLLGIGIGLAFAALGNLVVQAVPPSQTGVATGMNTVMRTLGGALGGQLSATFIVNNQAHGLPSVTGFEDTFVMAVVFLVVCMLAGLLVPGRPPAHAPLRLEAERAAKADAS